MLSSVEEDVNRLSNYLAHCQVDDLAACQPVDVIVCCVSSVLHFPIFTALESRPGLTGTLVLCGGIGHSTPLIYEAVAQSEKYQSVAGEVQGLSEARVALLILERFFNVDKIKSSGCRVLIEEKSTNCFLNAVESKSLLDGEGIVNPRSMIIIQDPTMALRTTVSFEKVFRHASPPVRISSCPTIVPRMKMVESRLEYDVGDVPGDELWDKQRFFGLILGEIPRLRDDENGYGPNGTDSIPHVDIPVEVEDAWGRLKDVLPHRR